MGSNGEQRAEGPQVTIPGIVPRRVHGASPSFGTWLEGHQKRLDRQVLLKVIPPRSEEAALALKLEIEGLLHLAGEGVPLVIDEGESAGVPYLIVEDADGVPLTPGSVTSSEDWQLIQELLLSIEERMATLSRLLLPVPFTSLRRLPSGGFALLELGWLIPFGETIPDLPQVPQDLRQQQALPGHRQRLLAASLATIGDGLGGAPPGWRQAIAILQREREVDRETLEGVLSKPAEDRSRLPWLVAVSLIIVVSWSLLPRDLQEGARSPQQVATEDRGEVDPEGQEGSRREESTVDAGQESNSGGAAGDPEGAGDPEEFAWQELEKTFPGAADPDLPLSPSEHQQLQQLLDEYPGTVAAKRARRALDHQQWAALQVALTKWQPLREVAGDAIGSGDLAAAERVLFEARETLRSAVAVGEVEGEIEGLAGRISDEGQQAFLQLEVEVIAAVQERRFAVAIDAIDARSPRLPRQEKELCQALRREVVASGERYRNFREQLERSRDAALAGLATATLPSPSMAAIEGLGEFPDLQQRHLRWRQHLKAGDEFLGALQEAANVRLQAAEMAIYQRIDGDPLRAVVEEVRSRSLIVRPAGSRIEKELAYSRLTETTLDSLLTEAREDHQDGDGALLLFLLGNPAAALAAIDEGQMTSWQEDARAMLTRQHLAERDGILGRGREKARSGDFAGARAEALGLVHSLPRDLVLPVEEELRLWCRQYWQKQGPLEAFPGAELRWQQERGIELQWDFSSGADSRSWRGLDDSSDSRVKGGILLLRGSHRLASEGLPLPFAGRLAITWRVAYRDSSSPNINLVLWVDGEQESGEGLLAGVGFRPRGVATIDGSDGQVLLPANLLGPLSAVESGQMEKLVPPRIEPRVPVGTPVDIVVDSGPAGSELKVGGKTVITLEPAPRQHGTVEIRTYDSTLLIASILISGELAVEEWQRWLRDRVQRDLYSP